MALYECVFIARQDVSSTHVEALTDQFAEIITENDGQVTKREMWGLRSLAYRIKKNRKGHYVLLNIDAPSSALVEMERKMRIHEDVLRYLSLRLDAHEEGPSIVMQARQGRSERGGRDSRGFGRDGRGPGRDGRGGSRPETAKAQEGDTAAPAPLGNGADKAEGKPADKAADTGADEATDTGADKAADKDAKKAERRRIRAPTRRLIQEPIRRPIRTPRRPKRRRIRTPRRRPTRRPRRPTRRRQSPTATRRQAIKETDTWP